MFYLKGTVITDGKMMENMYVEISEETITYVGSEKRYDDCWHYEVNDGYICPGLIDIHIHGVDGHDFMDSDRNAFALISRALPKYGVTSYLATSRTCSLNDIKYFLESAKCHTDSKEGSKLLGIHLEGPWINEKYSGAQKKEFIRQLTWQDVNEVINPYVDIIKRITLAPEKVIDLTILKHLNKVGINVSAGHTNATLEEIENAMSVGIRQTTHTFNAMSPVHHRHPGAALAAMYYDEILCELIADGVHVHPKVISLLHRVKGMKRIALVSDCTGYNNIFDGEYEIRGKVLFRSGNKVTLQDGTLAGSVSTLDKVINFAVEQCQIPLEQAVYMGTETPLSALDNNLMVGKIAVGYQADIVLVNKDFHVMKTYINGKIAYSEEEN